MDTTKFMAAQEPEQMTIRDVMVNNALEADAAAAAADRAGEERLEVIAWQINLWEGQAKDVFRKTALKIGEYLVEAQALCPRGRWGEWLRAKLSYSERKAQQLMQVYEGYRDKQLTGDYEALSFTQIYQLLSAPEESRDALAKRAAEEALSTRQLKAEIERLRDEAEARQERMAIEAQDAYNEGAAAGRDEQAETVKALRLRLEKAEDEAKAARAKAASAEASMGAIRDTAARANGRAAEAEEALAKVKAELKAEKARAPEVIEVMPESARREMEAHAAHAERVKIENEALREQLEKARAENAALKAAGGAPADGRDALAEAMEAAKAAISRAVSEIKAAQAEDQDRAKRAKNELMVICTAIAKKLGGASNEG